MKPRAILGLPACALLALCCACGVPGAPQPPSLKLPKPVRDLRAERKGDKVTLTWTAPRQTTDQQGIRQLGVTRVCRSLGTEPASACTPVGEVPGAQAAPNKPVTFADALPAELQQQNLEGFVSYAVETANAEGRSAGLSNQVTLPAAPTLPPPAGLAAEVTAEGVVLNWARVSPGPETPNVHYVIGLYRQTKGATTVSSLGTADLKESSFIDRTVEWEKTYLYSVNVTTVRKLGKTAEVEQREVSGGQTEIRMINNVQVMVIPGDSSSQVEVFAHDVFPPAVPAGLEAVYTPVPQQAGFIDLTWAPNTEADLAGCNVYRHEEGAAPVKVNSELVKTPAFRDTNVAAGHRYFYSVSAVDLRGNESGKSNEATETVPQ